MTAFTECGQYRTKAWLMDRKLARQVSLGFARFLSKTDESAVELRLLLIGLDQSCCDSHCPAFCCRATVEVHSEFLSPGVGSEWFDSCSSHLRFLERLDARGSRQHRPHGTRVLEWKSAQTKPEAIA